MELSTLEGHQLQMVPFSSQHLPPMFLYPTM